MMAEKPLSGKKILITRARDQAAVFATSLRDLGAEVVEFPTIEIVSPLRWDELDRAIDQLGSYDWLIFTSANGVNFFWQRLEERGKGLRLPSSLKVCAIGPATAYQLKEKGIEVDYTPKEFVAEAILKGFEKMMLKGRRILLARARQARDILPKGLRQMGAKVDVVIAYRTIRSDRDASVILPLLDGGKVDVITFTSPSTVTHFLGIMGPDFRLPSKVRIAFIGPVTAGAARNAGLAVDVVEERYASPGLVDALAAYFERQGAKGTV